jgi:hypothetical protein
MANYYFVATLLPPLKVGSPPEIGSRELDFILRQNLAPADFEKVGIIRRLVDIENLRATIQKQPLEAGGNLDAYELEEALLFKKNLPSYVLEFLDQYPDANKQLEYFPELIRSYFAIESKHQSGFLADYLTFEWQWRLVFVALRAKELDRDLKQEFRFEDSEDQFVAQILAQNESSSFDPPAPYNGLKALFESRKTSPLALYQALSEWRFMRIEESIEWEHFSLNRILGYVAELEICEKWLELDKRKGLQILQEMIET